MKDKLLVQYKSNRYGNEVQTMIFSVDTDPSRILDNIADAHPREYITIEKVFVVVHLDVTDKIFPNKKK